MTTQRPSQNSIATEFTRHYLIISIVPSLIILILMIIGIVIARNHMINLITKSTYDLNLDAEQSLQHLGEEIIINKAKDVARQADIYFRAHPDLDITQMRKDPAFMAFALQKVGITGYTSFYEAGTWIFRIHPDPKLIDKNVKYLAKDLPSWWKIVEATHSGQASSGYYDWYDPDGSRHKKFMSIFPVSLKDKIIMVAATSYIDEFSMPMVAMKKKADRVVDHYQGYIANLVFLFGAIVAAMLLATFLGTYYLGKRTGMRYIEPITRLAKAAKDLGEGKWDAELPEHLLIRKDEAGVMAQSFLNMSRQLKDTFFSLEQRLEELRQAQDALAVSEDHYRTLYEESQKAREVYRSLIDSSADAIVMCNLEEKVTYVSPMFTAIFGWRTEELTGKPLPFVPPSEAAETASVMGRVRDTGIPCHGFETRRSTADGRIVDVSLSASRYNDHEGKPAGILSTLRDISEARRMKEHLQQVERLEAIATLAGGIAHDFNNLLMVIQGTVSVLIYETHQSDPRHRHFINIEKQVNRGARLTKQLLGYARKGKYDIQIFSLNDLVRESAETLRQTRKDIRIHYRPENDLSPIEADPYQMEQVLMNLLINASDAMSAGGDLTLTTTNISARDIPEPLREDRKGRYVLLTVEDTGVGMDKKTMDRIFEPFFTTKAVNKGTGLGLASAYGIVKSHGGTIGVASESGAGTTFSIYLPATDKEASNLVVKPQKKFAGKGLILIIDDEKPVLDVASQMLERIGYQTLKADSGAAGLALFEREKSRIDLVILDMIMPDMGGGDVFDRLKAMKPNIKVLLSSGYSLDGKATEILNRGCNGFMQKPFGLDDLWEKVSDLLKRPTKGETVSGQRFP